MKRFFACAMMVVAILTMLNACGKNTSTWQEQYDLGVRYLSEGNYNEATIAFTAAIEIDPKRADAYLGLANVYEAQGDLENLRAILEQGIDATEDDTLRERWSELESQLSVEDVPVAEDPAIQYYEDGAVIQLSEGEIRLLETEGATIDNLTAVVEVYLDPSSGTLMSLLSFYGDWSDGTPRYNTLMCSSDDEMPRGVSSIPVDTEWFDSEFNMEASTEELDSMPYITLEGFDQGGNRTGAVFLYVDLLPETENRISQAISTLL